MHHDYFANPKYMLDEILSTCVQWIVSKEVLEKLTPVALEYEEHPQVKVIQFKMKNIEKCSLNKDFICHISTQVLPLIPYWTVYCDSLAVITFTDSIRCHKKVFHKWKRSLLILSCLKWVYYASLKTLNGMKIADNITPVHYRCFFSQIIHFTPLDKSPVWTLKS